jgi:tetratricopeptide (TPR) repeat protein
MRGLQGARPRRIFLSIAPVLLFLALGAHAVGLPDSLDAGIELFRTGRYSEAMEAFGEMLHGDGSGRRGAAVLYWLGECSLALGDHEEARRYFRAAADVPDPVPFYASRSLLRLGAVLERLDRGGEAADAYGRILARYAGEQPAAEAVFRLGGISYRDGLYGSAASFYSKLLIDYPASPLAEDSRFFLAESERALGSLDEAKRRYGIVLSSGGSRWRSAASFRLAEISVMQGELEEAAVLVDGLVSRVPEDEWTGRAYKLKGEILLARESYWEAVLSFEEAIPLLGEKERQDSCYLRGIALEQCRCPGEAVDSFRQSGNGEKPRAELAILLAQMGRGEEAAREFETLLSLYPQSLRREEFLGYLAGVYWEAGDASRSLKALDALVKDFSASPRFVEYLYRRATVSMTIGLFPDALSDLQRILKDFPLSGYGPESLYCVGFVYSRRGEYIRALRFFNNAADSAPTPALALRARRAIASCMFDMGNLGEALTAFRSLLPQAKDEATRGSLIFDIARTLYKLGRLDEAADGFLEASRTVFSPSEAEDALYWRAWCLSRLERPVSCS